MKLINKKNTIPIICITYTCVSVALTIFEIISKKEINETQFNMFLFLILSILAVGVLSQHYRLERFSPLAVIVIQYVIAIGVIIIWLWITSFFMDIHPNGYRDMIFSFSIPYFIGTIIYYVYLKKEIKKQNQLINNIKNRER
ncbi:DUF3021 family protein [Clostridium niameyense]|uniref:DUF3021 family protein n=1 Tax=Clostridium niameyense TaxID=1622073 RepID=A0A6M0RAG5_9CLOT|nr:DUF6608 family protein [Clostridium niameyense]NEZ46208.1 DUF3021 family protein [Clostridium niameyense]